MSVKVLFVGRTKTVASSSWEIHDYCGSLRHSKGLSGRRNEGKEYDICSECWKPVHKKLRGKGRVKNRETVFYHREGNQGTGR